MNTLQNITCYFPSWLCEAAAALSPLFPEEIRLRAGQRPMAFYAGKEHCFFPKTVTPQELEQILLSAAKHSRYAVTDKLCEGYLTVDGGHRIGVCGTASVKDGRIINLKSVSSLCIRIAQDRAACFDIANVDISDSTLIIGRPGSGKTTLLRAIIQKLSDAGNAVGVCDCRGEIAAVQDGLPRFPLGEHTDVLSGTKMAEGLMMLLRTMRPGWLCADEITAEEDLRAMDVCSFLGVKILATAHAGSVFDLRKRPLYRRLLHRAVFGQVICIENDRRIRVERMSSCSE